MTSARVTSHAVISNILCSSKVPRGHKKTLTVDLWTHGLLVLQPLPLVSVLLILENFLKALALLNVIQGDSFKIKIACLILDVKIHRQTHFRQDTNWGCTAG